MIFSLRTFALAGAALCLPAALAVPMPAPTPAATPASFIPAPVVRRTEDTPYFPEYPPSCGKCQADYGSLGSCIDAAPAFANPILMLLNPGSFVDIIKCGCTETFQAVYPQCIDCFTYTNQTQYLQSPNEVPSILSGIKQVCAVGSGALGGVASENTQYGSLTPTNPAIPAGTATESSAALRAASLRMLDARWIAAVVLGTALGTVII